MRAFWSFLILLTSALLWLIPVTQAVYDFRTDQRDDTFGVSTAVGSTNATVVLIKPIYDSDTSTVSVTSNNTNDSPSLGSYNGTTRSTRIDGLSTNSTHTLYIAYDIDALSGDVALSGVMDLTPYLWYVIIVAFPVAALAALFTGRL